MPEIDKPNPYGKPILRSAWEEEWNAFQEEKPPPDVNLFDDLEDERLSGGAGPRGGTVRGSSAGKNAMSLFHAPRVRSEAGSSVSHFG
jgi:hypothetical protein